MWLKQSTVFTDRIGPVIDSSGVEYGGLVIGDLSRTKNGTTTTMAAASAITYDTNGYYSLTTIAGDSDTLGRLVITCNKSTYQMPPRCYMVLTAATYDALVTNAWNAANGGGDIQRIAGNTQTAGDLYAYLTTNLGSLGANLSGIPKTGFILASNGLASVTAWTVNITGNLSGSVGSVTGAVASVTAVVSANLTQILGTALTETVAGYICAGVKKFFNVATPTSDMNTMTNLTNAPANGDFTATMKTSLGTAQTGDCYAIVNSGTYGNSAIKAALGTAQTGDCFAIVNSGTFGNSAIKSALGTAQTGDAYAIVSSGTYGNSAIKTALGAPMQASSYVSPTGASVNVTQIGGTSAAGMLSTTGVFYTAALANAPSGSGPTADQIAAKILKTPANLIATNSDNSVNASGGGTTVYVSITAAQAAAALTGAAISITRGDTVTVHITGLGTISGSRTKLAFTAKLSTDDPDSSSLIQVTENGGLTILNSSTSVTSGHASLTVINASAGDVDLVIGAAETAQLKICDGVWDVSQFVNSTVKTLGLGTISIVPDVTRATS
jgi:hypothetical protein